MLRYLGIIAIVWWIMIVVPFLLSCFARSAFLDWKKSSSSYPDWGNLIVGILLSTGAISVFLLGLILIYFLP